MAEAFNEEVPIAEQPANQGGDVEMAEGVPPATGANEVGDNTELPFAEGGEVDPRTTFVSYLSSPIVTLIVGSGDSETILSAHQGLLVQSPFFAEACAAFTNDGSVRSKSSSSRCAYLRRVRADLFSPLFGVAATN